ncbi:MAG: 4Fe-4S dicluster domain-containing protein [Thermodesulfobacteriota bacterium]
MLFSVLLYGSLSILLLGTAWRVSRWFTRKIGPASRSIPSSRRVSAALKGIVRTLFSGSILTALRVFFVDGLLQWRILKEDALRWVMHMCIFAGFLLLLLMHALESHITVKLFKDYYSTANPFFFLRELFGVLVLIGVCLALFRRFILKVPRLKTRAPDIFAIIILTVIIGSGFFLEGAKMLSHGEFMRMVEDWSDAGDPAEVQALESYWVDAFGLHSPSLSPPFSEEILSEGREIHEMSCEFCHAPAQWAFASYGVNRAMAPAGSFLERIHAVTVLWYIHILACFAGLAYLPFSKMFHIIATPVGLAVSAVTDRKRADPANVATRQAIELDACTQCGTCSLRCSVAPAVAPFGNPYILPSERMAYLRRLGRDGLPGPSDREALRQGACICSNCDRCTVVCPSGINLREFWMCVREDLVQQGEPEPAMLSPFSFFRGLQKATLDDIVDYDIVDYNDPLQRAMHSVTANGNGKVHSPDSEPLDLTRPRESVEDPVLEAGHFTDCFGCRTCTTVCPVVGNYEDPVNTLGLLPHQIMFSLGLGLPDTACRSRMLWDCVTCYQCEEHCPQGVRITDILYTLKNRSIQNRLL